MTLYVWVNGNSTHIKNNGNNYNKKRDKCNSWCT